MKNLEELNIDALKRQAIQQIINFNHTILDDIKGDYEEPFSEVEKRMMLPMHYLEIYFAKYLFVENYCDHVSGKSNFNNNFMILVDEINVIVQKNIDKKFLHFFFCNISLPSQDDLGLIFRFSDFRDFETDQDLDTNDGKSYLLLNNGNVTELRSDVKFTEIREKYKEGIGRKIETNGSQSLTQYITYDMNNLKLFKDFEHNLVFEAICKVDSNNKLRLGLAVYIKDKDRVHHTNETERKQYFEGYYDAGDLKP